MPSVRIAAVPKRALDFATLATGGSQEVILADRIELVPWRDVTLKVQVHSHNLTGSNTITIIVYPQSWTTEEPALSFVAASAASQAIGAATPSPGAFNVTLPMIGSGKIAGMARIVASGSRAGAGTMQASVSLELFNKIA